MVHASMRAIGPLQHGAEGLIRALQIAVGTEGTLIMNLGARDDWDWVNAHPEFERPSLLAGSPPFDYLRTPADPDNGVLAEVFRQLLGTSVNDHPDARFGARGRLANVLLDHLPWDDYYGPGSVLERLIDANGRILRLGADLATVTLLHYAEYLTQAPTKRRVRRHHLVLEEDRPRVRAVECLDDTYGIVDYAGKDYFAAILREYLATGAGARGTVGNARSELLESCHRVEFAVEWMDSNL